MPRKQYTIERRKIDTSRLPKVVREKWIEDDDVLDEGFVPFPKRLIRCLPEVLGERDGMSLLAVVLAVVDDRRPAQSRPPSLQQLAHIAGLSATKFKRCLSELVAMKYATSDGPDEAIDVGLEGLLKEVARKTSDEG